jgi:hypothetical protein
VAKGQRDIVKKKVVDIIALNDRFGSNLEMPTLFKFLTSLVKKLRFKKKELSI